LLAVLVTRSRLPIFKNIQSVPTDIFVFGIGEPNIPYTTKVGGVPFRPSDKPWPEHEGKKMTFLAQFCFSDSLDLFSFSLPGNLLVIFFTDFPNIERDTYYHYEWYTWEGINKPMSYNDIPVKSFLRANFENNIMSWYCVKYRTVDYPQADLLVSKYLNMKYIEHDLFDRMLRGYEIQTDQHQGDFVDCREDLFQLAVLDGTKIGGIDPYYWTYLTTSTNYASDIVNNKKNHFLCSLASIFPVFSLSQEEIPYPFVNRPICASEERDDYSLLIFDVGRFHFYISDDKEMFCEWST
jgi:uncharacterized protein YwqG